MSTQPNVAKPASIRAVAPKPAAETTLKVVGKHTVLPVSHLEVDPATQRTLRTGHVKNIVSDFDPDFFGEPVVSHRGGHYFVVDGQHRVEALRQMGWGDQKIPVLLYEGLSLAEEAELFLMLQRRKAPSTFDKFRIQITSGDHVACDIDRIVRAQGLVLSDQQKAGAISAVVALREVYLGVGLTHESPALLAKTLRLLKTAWGPISAAFDGLLIIGAGMVLARYSGVVDEAVLAQKLARVGGGPNGIIARAKHEREIRRGRAASCVAAVMVYAYNEGRRTGKLEDWWS